MDVLSGLLAAITSFVSSVFALVAAMHAIEALPLGKAYFADTPLRGLTWGELGAWLLLFYGGALGIGLPLLLAHPLLVLRAVRWGARARR